MSSRAWQIVFLLVVFTAALYLAYRLRAIFIPVLIALTLAYILHPLVTKLEDKKVPRLASIAAIYSVFLITFALVILVAIPAGINQAADFVQETFLAEDAKILMVLERGKEAMEKLTGNELTDEQVQELKERLKTEAQAHAGDLLAITGTVAGVLGMSLATGLGALFAAISFVVLIPVYLFFFLRGMNTGWEKFKAGLPAPLRERILGTLGRIHRANAAFFRGQITICVIDGAILFLVLWIAGVRMPFLFGLLYAMLAIIPFMGPVSAFAITEIFVFANTGELGTQFWVVAFTFFAIQALEGIVLQPLILGKETGLHPIMIILSLMIFGNLLGILGMLLAVPLFSAALILTQDYVLPVFREVTSEAPAG